MIPNLPRIAKSARWHFKRSQGIGGSDWVSILSDQHPEDYKYGCIRRLYYEKKRVKPDFEAFTSRAAMRGNILEPVVAELFKAETGCTFSRKRPKVKMIHGKRTPKWFIGNPDYVPIMPLTKALEILECKTMNINVWLPFLEDGLSVGYKVQPQHYLALSGLEMAHVAVLWADGLDFLIEPVPRDESLIDLMLDAGDWFWNKMLGEDAVPDRPPTTPERCGGCVYGQRCLGKAYFNVHTQDVSDFSNDGKLYLLLNQVQEAKEGKRGSEHEVELANRELELYLEATYGLDVEKIACREVSVTWEKGTGSRFNKKELLADRPDLKTVIQEHTNHFPKRPLSVKVTKKSLARWASVTGKEQ